MPSYCPAATPTTTALCPTYNHQALHVIGDDSCYEIECSTALTGSILSGNSTTASSLRTCISFCNLYNVAMPLGCVGVNYLGAGTSPNCVLLSSITGTGPDSVGIDSGRLLYAGYPAVADPSYAATSTSTSTSMTILTSTTTGIHSSTTSSAIITTTTTTAMATTTATTTTTTRSTSTTSTTAVTCSAAPTASSCPTPSGVSEPYCYSHSRYGNVANYELECASTFAGAALQPLIASSLEDCIGWCQYQNTLTVNSCVGITFLKGAVVQGGPNNCFRYSSLTCASRSQSAYDSARMIYSGYPQMTDYGNSSFTC